MITDQDKGATQKEEEGPDLVLKEPLLLHKAEGTCVFLVAVAHLSGIVMQGHYQVGE